MQLTGPPRIGTLLMPYASAEGPVEVEWPPEESRLFKNRQGRIHVMETHLRGQITITWAALRPDVAAALVWQLQQTPVTVVPRTRAAGDPSYVEEVYLDCRVTAGLPSTSALQTDTLPVETELETLRTYEQVPGLFEPPAPVIEHGQHIDLFGGIEGEEVEGTPAYRWRAPLPYEGRLLRVEAPSGGSPTVRMLDESGKQFGEDLVFTEGSGYVELTEGAREVEIESLPPRPSVHLDEDTFALVLLEDTGDAQVIGARGRAAFEDSSYDLTFRGETYAIPTTRITPDVVASQYLGEGTRDGRATLLLDQ